MDNGTLAHVNFVKSKLMSTHMIKVKSTWIEDCVKFFISQDVTDNEMLFQQALEQFLLADVKEASNLVIPQTILQKKQAFTLNGTFVLQLQYLIDIGKLV